MTTPPRQLAYKDTFVEELQETVSPRFDTLNDFTDRYVFPDLTTQVAFVLYLNQTEWTQLYSAVLTGADLTYPQESHDTEYLFLQTVADPLAQLCAAIALCITEDIDVQEALLAFLGEHPSTGGEGNPGEGISQELLDQDMLPVGYGCTDDLSFGMAVVIADAVNEATTEVLQAIEILTNPLEIAAEIADNIPGVGTLATAADIGNWIQDTAKEEYDLAWSTTVRDELACLIWCAFKFDCDLTYEILFNVYLDASLAIPPGTDTLAGWMAWLILLPFTNARQTAAAISLLGLIAMKYGGKFGEFVLGVHTLDTLVKLSEDASNSNWDILCDDCAWCIITDWSEGANGWAKAAGIQGAGVLEANGWNFEDIEVVTEGRRTIFIEKSFTSATLTKIDLLCDVDVGTFSDTSSCLIFITELAAVRTDVVDLNNLQVPSADDQHLIWNGTPDQQADYIGMFIRVSKDITVPLTYDGDAFYYTLEVCGTGQQPGDL